ncbi:MAG: ThuA domain-containing protein, partial [Bacteroidota bacterium]|nr:ThuA domain-containing protein [Bacteroidota bacterium]
MRKLLFRVLPGLFLLPILMLTACNQGPDRVLIFSHTAAFRHDHIPTARDVVHGIAQELGMEVDTTENPVDFNEENLARYDAVVFLSTTGDVFDRNQQIAFQRFIQNGGGYLGIHSASDTEYDWPWYGQLVGGYFAGHAHQQEASLDVVEPDHPVASHLPERWTRFDEWYNIRFVNPDIIPLVTIDETTYDPGEGGSEGDSHPLIWYHHFDGGRSLYVGPGHTMDSWAEPEFLQVIRAGLEWVVENDDSPIAAEQTPYDWDFDVDILTTNLNEPMELATLPDGRVLFIERPGTVHVVDPEAGTDTVVNELEVAYGLEDGLLGLALDPNFSGNGWLYLYYSPTNVVANRLSRFSFDGERIVLESEVVLLEVTTQRDTCCHAGGAVEFGPDGNLYLSTGDNTNPFEADSSAPIDERPGRSAYDAQGTSANSQDLRGKVLRIRPEADGTYSIPEGNLFEDPAEGRPEIYTMGHRTP